MDKGKKRSDLTTEEIMEYLSGNSTPNTQYNVEKKMLSDAFAAEVTEGFGALKLGGIDEKTTLIELRKRLSQRTQINQKNA